MISLSIADLLASQGPEAIAAWDRASQEASRLDATSDHFLFHGTKLSRAKSIMTHGFCHDPNNPGSYSPYLHVYWAPLKYAINFASRCYGDRPALMAAKLEDILASGTPLPMTAWDRQCEDEPELQTWQQSIAENGCLRLHQGVYVKNMRLLGL